MGPNCVKIAEELISHINLSHPRRILDLGCGKGLTSILLASRYDAQIFAADLWIEPTENFERFKMFGLDDRIFPIHAEAHALPFARGYFDAVVSIDSFPYYGAVPGYLDEHIVPLVKPGGLIAVAVPGLQKDLPNGMVPAVLEPFWQEDMNFYSAAWWRELWEQSSLIQINKSFSLACHKEAWSDWLLCDNPYAKQDIPMMEAENGDYFDTIGLIATVL